MSLLDDMPSVERPPRLRIVPAGQFAWEFAAEDACDLAAAYLNDLNDWQRDILSCWLAEDNQGNYAATTCGLMVPRQNGKTEVVAARILYGMLFGNGGAGEIIAYSAHSVEASLVVFNRLLDVFGDDREPPEEWKHPEMHSLVAYERFTNGHQAIRLKNGSEVSFNARSTGRKRSQTFDVMVYDEAGFLTDDQQSASKSTAASAPHGNPQMIYLGTPPSEHGVYAEPFARVRNNALAGHGRTCWHEWSIERLDRDTLADRNIWAECNPAMGAHLLASFVESELMELSAEKFAIERLCWWPETATAGVFDAKRWDTAAIDLPELEEGTDPIKGFDKMAVGVKFAPDGLQLCVSVALLSQDGASETVHIELLHSENTLSGIQWLVDELIDGRKNIALVAIDGRSGAENLGGALIRAGMPKKAVHVMAPHDAVTATAMTTTMLAEGRLTHNGDETLAASAKNAVKRRIGTDGYGLGGDSCAIESACAALWAVVTTKRNPKRKQLIG